MNNPIVDKSKKFALRIIHFYKELTDEQKEFVLSKQILRSGTSIGANVRESQRGESKADFIHKLSISLKEADETQYWLELLEEGEFITKERFNSFNEDVNEIIRLLTAIIKSSKNTI